MKAVLISIRPKWCELIASGKKTVEVRKNRPKLETPFKVYIYYTRHKPTLEDMSNMTPSELKTLNALDAWYGKVIGEFVCDKIFDICIEVSKPDDLPGYPFPCTGLTDKEIMQYLGNGKTGYGWHISDLVMYDSLKELSEFYRLCDEWEKDEFTPKCRECYNYERNDADMCYVCAIEGEIPVTRAPQSWCYVEELDGG